MTRRMQLDDVDRVAVPAQPAISPDGTAVVYAVTTVDREADELRSALWRVSAVGGEPVPLTRGTADSAPAWSPDGSQLAFLRRPGDPPAPAGSQPASPRRPGDAPAPAGGQPASPRRPGDAQTPEAQLWLLPAAAGEPRQLTALPGGAGDPVWSPDGSRIAFTAPVDDASGDEHAPVVADRLGYKLDGVGWWRGKRRHVFVVDIATGTTTQVTRGDWHAGSPAWSPDGRQLAFPAATAPDADLTGESRAYLLDLDTGEQRPVTPPGGLAGPVSWTPDGEALLVVGRRDVRPGHEQLLRVALPGGEVTTLAPGLDRNVMPGRPGYPGGLPQLAPDGRTLLFCVRDRGCTHLYALDLGTDTPRRLLGDADRVVSGLSVARHAPRAAVVVASPTSYGEVAVLDVDSGDLTIRTDHSLPDVELLVPEERVFPVSDGREVHGWLLRDRAARTPAPMLLDMHGGPHNAWSPVPSPGRPYWQLLAARGWAVLALNPRGSDGYGEDFYTAAVGSWGVADERDLLEPVDALVSEGVADPDRLALTGYSYGGYLTCWLTGRTDRFRAAVSGGPVADLASMAGTSDMGHLGIRLEVGALPYQDPEQVARQSPYTRVGEVTTPTLLLQGAADDRCPPGQAEQWFAALRGREVPARLVLYPGASHLFLYNGRPSHRRDYSQRLVDWVTRHTRKAPPPVDQDRWQQRLTELAERYQVPGAVLGVAAGEERLTAVHGVTNLDTGVAVTPETLFQIGSITKVLTATAVLRLVEAGRLDLDQPVVGYFPELTLADPEQRQRVTMRHLLTHTSGIDGDFFHDTGRGDDCLARYVAELATQPPNHPLGATFSYCNSGFSLAGRVIEVLTGKVWDEAMRELLFAPLGLARVATLPEEALLHRAAVGHPYDGDGPPYRAPVWGLPRSGGPAGASLATTVDDLLTVVRLHLSGGLAPDGTRLLTAESVDAMQSEQVRLPDKVVWLADSWGLGWNRADWGGIRVIGHTGQTIGQSAFLNVLPEQDLAVALLTNGGHANDLYLELVPELVRELTGGTPPPLLAPPDPLPAVDLAPYAGTYQRFGVRYDVWQDGSGPQLRVTSTHEVPGLDRPPQESPLVPVADGLFAVRPPGERIWAPVTFYQLSDGSPYLQLFRRATPKVG